MAVLDILLLPSFRIRAFPLWFYPALNSSAARVFCTTPLRNYRFPYLPSRTCYPITTLYYTNGGYFRGVERKATEGDLFSAYLHH